RQTDHARQEPRAPAVHREADLAEELAELRAVGGDDEVAAERQVRAGADGVAVHHRDRRQRKAHEPEHEPVEQLHPPAPLGRGVAGPHGLHVAARAEVATRPVRITTRAVGSASISSSTPSISRRMARSSALRASGRFSVIVAIPSARSTSRVWYPTFRSFRWSTVERRHYSGRPAG